MTEISWDNVGERFFETGIDRGVLYIDDEPGVAWNGIISIDESPSGGEAKPFYQDGIKYQNRASPEEFKATLTALSSPVEFDSVDGTLAVYTGLFATQQRRKSFGLSYRTKKGNDTLGLDYGYKIHLVYNVLASPATHNYETINETIDPMEFSWELTTTPISGIGFKPTAHFIIDSEITDPEVLADLETILYGSDAASARLPTFDEISTIYEAGGIDDPEDPPPPVVYGTTLRVARQSLEALIKELSAARVARQSSEILISSASASRLSRQSVDAVITGPGSARATRQSVEVVITN